MQSTQPAKTSSLGSDFLRFFGAGSYNQQPPPPDDPNRITRDGHPAKRRGPKPNSKPAMTRRQELNRQAQRSHRERKEQYIRTMETEVSRLREAYTQEISAANVTVQQHRHMVYSLTEENDILKEILSAHGISYESELESRKSDRPGPGYHQSSPFNSSMGSSTLPTLPPSNHGQNNAYTTPPTTVSSNMSPRNGAPSDLSPKSEPSHAGYSHGGHGGHGHAHHQCEPMGFMDRSGGMVNGPIQDMGGIFETDPQLQIDFILTLESPCREHTDYLCRRSIVEADDEDMPFSGHALMATCPPPSYLAKTTNENPYPHQTYDLPHANLSTLLNLSRQLVTDQQVTPIMALQCLKQNEMYRTLTRDDVKIIIETLNTKVRCYGFGAVMEEFELSDCLGSVIGAKVDAGAATVHDEFMYA